MRTALSKKLGAETFTAQTSATLRSLEHALHEGPTKEFLTETIDCFEVGTNRATITMAWMLAIDHLYTYVLKNKLPALNTALAADKGVKLNSVSSRGDLTEIKEGKFIELCRVAKIISHDARKILDGAIGTRNSSAHPSGVKIGNVKVISIVEDLVENVVLKYPV